MADIKDTIKKAIQVDGESVLKNKGRLCLLLEDLSPDLTEDRRFLEKVYSNTLGGILHDGYVTDRCDGEEYLKEADQFLKNKEGYSDAWRERLLAIFRALYEESGSIRMKAPAAKEASGTVNAGYKSPAEYYSLAHEAEKTGNTEEALRYYRLVKDGGPFERMAKTSIRRLEGTVTVTAPKKAPEPVKVAEPGKVTAPGKPAEPELSEAEHLKRWKQYYEKGDYFWAESELEKIRGGKKYEGEEAYKRGVQKEPDAELAFMYYLRAAKAGHPLAMLKVAYAYENGRGVNRDLYQAEVWFSGAWVAGVNSAKEEALRVNKKRQQS